MALTSVGLAFIKEFIIYIIYTTKENISQVFLISKGNLWAGKG